MDQYQIEQSLTAAEASVRAGNGLEGTGFWRVVAAAKADREVAERYADRIAVIDAAACERWAMVTMSLGLGTALMVIQTVVGVVLIGWAYFLSGLTAVIVFYAGFVALLVSTHGLAHLVVGRLMGIRFTRWFIAALLRPQPGVKVDYASYLRTPADRRAWMHASGALTTKILPFALLGAAIAADLPAWAVWGLVVIGVGTIVTDVLWSTKSSDWKRFRRERAFAQPS